MTTTIYRPIWLRTRILWLGLAAILIAVTVALYQSSGSEPADVAGAEVSTVTVSPASASYWIGLQMMQDNYLPPTVDSQVASGEVGAIQAIPPYIQDGYLGPATISRLDPNRLSDDRTGGPR